ncbi:MAG: SprB repeat-containing protein [Flavobacteriales bacterium]|nr:SprB repeat-containing protein [Flavobacteriales bacterium]
MRVLKSLRTSLACGLLFLTALSANAQLTVATQNNLQQLAGAITGPGVSILNPVISCGDSAYGEFSYTGSLLGLEEGIVLTTGRRTDALGPNNVGNRSFNSGTPGDAILDNVTGRDTYNRCRFEFDIIPTGDSLKFDFVFASEEYNEWVGSQFNDVFGFFISGPGISGDPGIGADHNIALIPGTTTPVAINNVNNALNSSFYTDNTGGSEIQYDGFTQGLSAEAIVQPCQTYHLKLIVADASDRLYDSGVFIERIESPTITLSTYTLSGASDMVEACNPGWIRFDRGDPRPTALTLQYFLQGTATNGSDYSAIGNVNPAIAKSITIPANASYVDRPVNPLFDNITETDEYIRCIIGNPNCPSVPLDTVLLYITDSVFATLSPSGTICAGDSMQLTVAGGASYSWLPAAGLSCTNCPNPWAHPTNTTNYSVLVSDGSCTRTISRRVNVSHLALTSTITDPLCNGSTNGAINLTLNGGIAPYSYSWTGPNGFTAFSQDITNLEAGTYSVVVTDAACTRAQSWNVTAPGSLSVSVSPNILAFGQNISCQGGNDGSITSSFSGGTGPYTIAWSGPSGFTSSNSNISNLIAGTYNFDITDAHGCAANTTTTLTEAAQLTASIISSSDMSCFGDGLGSATVAGAGGVPPYAYSWNSSPTQSVNIATSLPLGSFTATVTDGYNCSATASVNIGGPTTPLTTVLTGRADVTCNGSNNGTASIGISGGTPPYTSLWNTIPAQNGTSATGLPPGIWDVTVTDANGCTTTRSVPITEPTSPLIGSIFSQTNLLCFGNSTGSVAVAASGGSTPYSFLWNTTPAQASAIATGLPAGTWTCTITDARGCITLVNATITQPTAPLAASITSQTDVLCFGNSTGSATVSVSGGTSAYSYSWNTTPVQTNATATGLAAGNYSCTVNDANGCTTTANVAITQPAAALNASISAQTNVLCSGNSTGSATVSANGGTGIYSYSWNTTPVQTSSMATGLAAGNYTCTVTDANGCSSIANASITEPTAALSASISAQTDVLCFGNNTGSATASANGGTGAYSFNWNTVPVQTTATAINLTAGPYTCTVTDVNGCSTNTSVTITQPVAALTAVISAQTNVLCFGNSTGSGTASAIGGTAPFTFSWNTFPVQTTANVTGLAAGSHTCTITDANGCITSVNVTITQPAATMDVTASITPAACQGANNGAVNATVTGGTGAYTYVWNGPNGFTANTQDIAGIEAGAYNLVTTDANGCTHTSNWNVNQPGLFTLSGITSNYTGGVQVSCIGATDGSIDISVSGATPPYTYLWTGSSGYTNSVQDISGLAAGTYTFIVTDANGCSTSQTFTLNVPTPFNISLSGADQGGGFNISCNSGNNGTIDATAAGGSAPLAYAWSGPNGFTAAVADISGLVAGTYNMTVTDVNGCTANSSISLTEPNALNATASSSAQVDCVGGSNGSATSNGTGGVAPFTYQWNTVPVQNTQNANGLTAGTWMVTITDANSCTSNANVVITEPAGVLSASIIAQTDVLCFGNSTGSATASASAGTAPYSYSWNTIPAQNSATAAGLIAGTYTCTITDANGCSTTVNATFIEPSASLAAAISGQSSVSCFGGADGSAIANATGGTGPYTFDWNTNPAQNGVNLTNVSAGIYTVSVSDGNGCAASAQVTIAEPSAPLSVGTVSIIHQDCFGSTNGQATVNVTGGTGPYTYSWNTNPAQTAAAAIGLGAGTYTVVVTDARNCTASLAVTINGPSVALALNISSITDVLCFGSSTGGATVDANGGTAPYSYEWSTAPQTFAASIVNQPAGTYAVIVTDANGCMASINTTINQPLTEITPYLESISMVNCFGGSDGFATIDISGGSGSYSVLWNTFPTQSGNTVTGLGAGTYLAVITDNNGCSTSKFFPLTITEPNAALAATSIAQVFGGGYNTSCSNANDGSIDATISGGTLPYTYAWADPFGGTLTTEDITGLAPGNYDLLVTDDNGCTAVTNATINAPAPIDITSTIVPAACQGAATGSINTNPLGGVAPYTLSWTGPNGFTANTVDIAGLVAGIYTLNIIDANGCSGSFQLDVNQPGLFTITATLSSFTGGANVSCATATDGSIDVTVTGGTPSYTYNWTGPNGFTANTKDISGLSEGTYDLQLNDDNGCGTLVSCTITAPAPLNVSLIATPYDVDNISCNGGNDGSIDATIIGGTAPYSITWTGPSGFTANSEDIGALAAGEYDITVTDVNGCSANTTITLTEPVILNASAVPSVQANGDNISCNGSSDGSIDLGIFGGHGPYTVQWTGPNGFSSTSQDNSDLVAGTYDAIVTDNSGCSTTLSVTLTEPTPLDLSSTVSSYIGGQAISCDGANDGSIDLTISGGAGSTSFAWTGPNAFVSASEDVSNLPPGVYQVVVSDQNGCSLNASFNLVAPQPIGASANIVTAACQAAATGSIDLTAIGGTLPFSFFWSGPGAFSSTNEDLSTLFAGVYNVTITDANGCSLNQSFDVNEPDLFTITATISTYAGGYNVSCAGSSDGGIDATVTGGTGPYFYFWSGPNGFTAITEDIAGLDDGIYDLTLTDQNGCSALTTYALIAPTPINIGLVAGLYNGGVNTTCASTPDGTIDATIAGGDQPYTIAWSGTNGFVSASEDITGAAAGEYTLVVTDAIGCSATSIITLVEPTAVSTSVTAAVLNGGSSTSCNGGTDGSIDLTIAEGTQPYTIAWSGPNGFGSNNEDINNLSAGDYTAVVTDANGCTSASSITLTAPSVIDIDLTASQFSGGYNIPCFGSSVGTITSTINGGLPGYTYLWSSNNGFSSTSQDLSGLPAGDYTIIVTDANGCTGTASITLLEPVVLDATNTLSATGNGYEVSCAGNDGAIALDITGGTQPAQVGWFSTNGYASQDEDITGLSAGTYELTIIDDNGCNFSDTLVLTQPEQLVGTITPSGVICNGANDGNINLEVIGGASAYTYAWTGPNGFTATTQDLSGLSSGNYSVTVSDNGNCTGTWSATIVASGSMTADVYRSDYGGISIPCFGDSTGVIEVGVLGGVDPLTIAWTGPNGFTSSAYDLSGLIAGDYQFTITDANGCTMDSTINLTQPITALGNALTAMAYPERHEHQLLRHQHR